jgi:hypothetical protein
MDDNGGGAASTNTAPSLNAMGPDAGMSSGPLGNARNQSLK